MVLRTKGVASNLLEDLNPTNAVRSFPTCFVELNINLVLGRLESPLTTGCVTDTRMVEDWFIAQVKPLDVRE